MNEISIHDFDYSILDSKTTNFLKEKENNMKNIVNNASERLGKELYEAQQNLSKKGYGCFEEWYTSLGFKKQSVYNYINRYSFVQSLDDQKQIETFQELSPSLQNEVSKKSANPEVNKAVFNGNVKTHKEYKDLEKQLKQEQQAKREAEQRAKQAKAQAENAIKSEQAAIRRLEELENQEPITIEKEIVKEVIPSNLKSELDESKRKLELAKKEIERLSKEQEYHNLHSGDFDEEQAERQRKKLQWEAEKNVLEMKIHVDKFLEQVSVNAFRKGAIASADDITRQKLHDSIDSLKNFIDEMELALNGRIKI